MYLQEERKGECIPLCKSNVKWWLCKMWKYFCFNRHAGIINPIFPSSSSLILALPYFYSSSNLYPLCVHKNFLFSAGDFSWGTHPLFFIVIFLTFWKINKISCGPISSLTRHIDACDIKNVIKNGKISISIPYMETELTGLGISTFDTNESTFFSVPI